MTVLYPNLTTLFYPFWPTTSRGQFASAKGDQFNRYFHQQCRYPNPAWHEQIPKQVPEHQRYSWTFRVPERPDPFDQQKPAIRSKTKGSLYWPWKLLTGLCTGSQQTRILLLYLWTKRKGNDPEKTSGRTEPILCRDPQIHVKHQQLQPWKQKQHF